MSRYAAGVGDEYEPCPNDRVLRNVRGLVDPRLVHETESSLLSKAYVRSLEDLEANAVFSAQSILRMHREWLEALYPFAGKLRTVDVSKDNFLFARAAFLSEGLAELDETLQRCSPCGGMGFDDLCSAIAEVHAELLFLHPFREGNGRLARWLADLMAIQAEQAPLDWGFANDLEGSRARYFAALHRGYLRDYRPLTQRVAEALRQGAGEGARD